MDAWLIYGPFDLGDASAAKVAFTFWMSTEEHHDVFAWTASVDGDRFYGQGASGATEGWMDWEFDLSQVSNLGDLTGRSRVWFAFGFRSDASTNDWGVFVDDVKVLKYVGAGRPPEVHGAESLGGSVSLSPIVGQRP